MARTLSRYCRSLRWHLGRAIEACGAGWDDWPIWAEASAFVAERAARRAAGAEAHALRVVAGACRGAAASPPGLGLPLLRQAARACRSPRDPATMRGRP